TTCGLQNRRSDSQPIVNTDSYDNQADTVASNPDTSGEKPAIPADLQSIIEAWPTLPEPLRAAVLAIVRSGG
ncbi:MAG: hypothetical protein KDA54_11745, partial [Phycisphaerales bacterium]|nr:hypothetical protein [Phycisphaerales bacterium]